MSSSRGRKARRDLERRRGPVDRRADNRPQITATQVTQQVTAQVTELIAEAWWSGPLPHPDDLERYEQIAPGMVEKTLEEHRIHATHVRTLETAQADHRRAIEQQIVTGIERRAGRGQFLAFALITAGVVGSVALGISTENAAAASAGLVGSLGVGGFVYVAGGRPAKPRDADPQ